MASALVIVLLLVIFWFDTPRGGYDEEPDQVNDITPTNNLSDGTLQS